MQALTCVVGVNGQPLTGEEYDMMCTGTPLIYPNTLCGKEHLYLKSYEQGGDVELEGLSENKLPQHGICPEAINSLQKRKKYAKVNIN
jgi:hypothetical protein